MHKNRYTQTQAQTWPAMRMTVCIQHPSSNRLMVRSANTGMPAQARTILAVSVTSSDLAGWYKWVLWSYVRLLHKPHCAETVRQRCIEREGGLLHHYKEDSHCTKFSSPCTCMHSHTTTTALQSNMCLPQNNWVLPVITGLRHTQTCRLHSHRPLFGNTLVVCPFLHMSVPTRNQHQTMTDPSGFHLSDQ